VTNEDAGATGTGREGAVLLTGGAGYIGSHTALALLARGAQVVVVDDLSTGFRSFVPHAATFIETSLADLTPGDLDAVDGVVHLAALKYAGVSVAEPLRFYRNNVEGMRALLDAMVGAGVELLVYSSSCSVYGTPRDERVVESTAIGPESPYGETKLIGEWLTAAVAAAHPLRHTSLRYFNVVGSGYEDLYDASPHNLFPLVFRAIEAGESPQVNGTDYPTPDGSCVRDYVHVGDLADAHVLAAARLEEGASLAPAYNIGTGTGASVLEIIAAVGRVLGRHLEPRLVGRRPGDPARIIADGSLAQQQLGWSARHDLDDMVRDAWSAWQQRAR
jgi:UDP-glucose 4-epimerase